MTTVRRWTGRESRALRQAMRLSTRDLAERLGVAVRTVTKWEALGTRIKLRLSSDALLDTLLRQADAEVQARFQAFLEIDHEDLRQATMSAVIDHRPPLDNPLPRRTVTVEAFPPLDGHRSPGVGRTLEPEADQDMHRRRLLEGMASLGLAGSVSAIGIEALRHDLVAATYRDGPAALSDWESIAWEYGYSYATTIPRLLLADLARDLAVAREQLDRLRLDSERRFMQRVIARLSVFLAQTLANQGDTRASYRWWGVARRMAEPSGDLDTEMWVRGREVISSLYESRPLPIIVDLADSALSQSRQVRLGTTSALAGRAQALALQGRTSEALAGVEATERAFEALPASVTNDINTLYGWPEYRLRYCQSFVFTYIGETKRAAQAQERALSLYPAHMFRERSQVQLHQALRLVRSGDVVIGANHAQQVISDLPEPHRNDAVLLVARSVIQAVPPGSQPPEVSGLKELLAVPATSQG